MKQSLYVCHKCYMISPKPYENPNLGVGKVRALHQHVVQGSTFLLGSAVKDYTYLLGFLGMIDTVVLLAIISFMKLT